MILNENLETESYLKWFLPRRKLLSSISNIARHRPEEIPNTIARFRSMDYNDPLLYKSGLLRETLESHFWLIENSGLSLDEVYGEMNFSIDIIIDNLEDNLKTQGEIIEFLFRLLEKRSLFKSSEYLALKVLNKTSCNLNDDLAAQLESYRTMKIGSIAPDFEFTGDGVYSGYESLQLPKKLSDVNTNYTVLVFGSSWCPSCPQELMQIAGFYKKWKNHDIEVVFVSLDQDSELFKRFATPFPFISISDYKKWDSPIVKSYHVFATPTIFLLGEKREILLRPNSVEQLDLWIDKYLLQRNK